MYNENPKKQTIKRDLLIAAVVGFAIAAILGTLALACVAGAMHYNCNHQILSGI